MPFTRIYTGVSLQSIDTFIPEEVYTTLNEALLAYGLSANETVSVTDSSYHTLSNSPTAKGTCILSLESTNMSAIFVCTKNSTSNNVSKISSVNDGLAYLTARWSGESIEIAAINNASSFDITVSIKT